MRKEKESTLNGKRIKTPQLGFEEGMPKTSLGKKLGDDVEWKLRVASLEGFVGVSYSL